jgi:hypothetical protein
MFPEEMKDLSRSLMGVSAFVSNILFWRERILRYCRRTEASSAHLEPIGRGAVLRSISPFSHQYIPVRTALGNGGTVGRVCGKSFRRAIGFRSQAHR